MNLRQLTAETIDEVTGRGIYLIGYSDYYINELCKSYDILPSVKGGFDERNHRIGEHYIDGHKIMVRSFDEISAALPKDVLLIIDGYPREVFVKLQKIKYLAENFSDVYFFADKEMGFDLFYREKYKNHPLQNIIVFRSGSGISQYIPGEDFNENARALFDFMLSNDVDKKYELVWFVKEPNDYIERYKERNVRFVSYFDAMSDNKEKRDIYYRYLCLAKYIFATHIMIFARNARQDQIRIQLWHGCGFKRTLRQTREEGRYEYMTVTSDMYAKFHAEGFGLLPEQMLVTGLPKEDWLFSPIADWQSLLGLPKAKHYMFWLPTWRTTSIPGQESETILNKQTGLSIFQDYVDLKNLDKYLSERNVLLIIKPHPWQNDISVSRKDFKSIFILEHQKLFQAGIFINEILGHADALISDYSSATVDFMLLDRPMAFTLDDYKEYGDSRGFYWDNIRDWLPGSEIFSADDFFSFVDNVVTGRDPQKEKREKLMSMFHKYKDGNNSYRVLKTLGIWQND